MKLATWNVNSIKARQELVLQWLEENNPDILMMQELKGLDFPARDQFEALGYHLSSVPQKTYNGVAILSKSAGEVLHTKLPGFEEDEQARYQEMQFKDVRVINIYLPNGNPVDTNKFPYKLKWMDVLFERLCTLIQDNIPFLVAGDFNIIPEAHDCYDPAVWAGDALFHPESLKRFRKIMNLGLVDAFRVWNQSAEQYSFWDYQGGAFTKNNGIRIDHFLLSPKIADRMVSCTIDAAPRAWERPSDHTPVILEIE